MIMKSATPRSRLNRPRGLRAGLIVGTALALVGAFVGTATGAVTPFQKVVIVNAPASPIPVTGTVNVANQPANQDVTVTNFPAVQPVSGTVNIGNLPATQPVSGTVTIANPTAAQVVSKVWSGQVTWDANEDQVFFFGGPINVSGLFVVNRDSDNILVRLDTVPGGGITVYEGDGSYTQNFTMPVPATSVTIVCFNIATDCTTWVSVVGS